MTVKEASQKWNIPENRLREYCKDKMVYKADKVNKKWVIPEEAEKPLPVKEVKAILYLFIVAKFKPQAADFSTVAWNHEDFREKCRYLQQMAYISAIDSVPDEQLLSGIDLTDKGLRLFDNSSKPANSEDTIDIIELLNKIAPLVQAAVETAIAVKALLPH